MLDVVVVDDDDDDDEKEEALSSGWVWSRSCSTGKLHTQVAEVCWKSGPEQKDWANPPTKTPLPYFECVWDSREV